MSKAGKKAAVAATKKSYAKCLKSDDAKPKGCPNRWTNTTQKYDKNSVTWKQRGKNPFRRVAVTYYGGDAEAGGSHQSGHIGPLPVLG